MVQHSNGKRIIHLAPGYRANDPRLYYLECLTLIQKGYEVDLVAHNVPGEAISSQVRLHPLGDYSPTLRWNPLIRLKRDQQTYFLAKKSGARLFHFHSLEFIPWGKRLRDISGRPVIFDCREDFIGYARQRRGVPNILRRPLADFVRRQLKVAARSCDAVIVADAGTANIMRPYARRVVVLHNFPRLELFPITRLRSADCPYDIVYHGSIPRYHLEVCLAIDGCLTKRGVNVRWRFIGYMPEKAWFIAELASRGIVERFTIDGPMPYDTVATEVQKAKIGIIPLPDLPKFRNNVPQKLFEFMALGMPVVLSDLPPGRAFVGDCSCAVLVPPNDYAAYAEGLIHLIKNAALREQMGRCGRRRVEERYNWERESQKLLSLYDELLAA
jgi:glycosyltransferase involved in cell wall biosynthesis